MGWGWTLATATLPLLPPPLNSGWPRLKIVTSPPPPPPPTSHPYYYYYNYYYYHYIMLLTRSIDKCEATVF